MAVSSTNSLLVQLERGAGALHRQIEATIRRDIRDGTLPTGTTLPATRALASELGVSRGVVVEAYQQLTAEGYLTSTAGGYTRVAAGRQMGRRRPFRRPGAGLVVDFGYGRADPASFPRAAWLRSIRRVLTETPNDLFNYLTSGGTPELRFALAEYLGRVRGTAADADDIVIANGYAQGVGLVVQVLAARGARRIAVEDPSSGDDAVPAARAAGLEVIGVPVREHGIDVDALEAVDADALVLTPSHQWPTGGVMPPESRAAVLRWAAEHEALIVEDDYDAEYRYDRGPIGAMQGLAPDRVVYAGTASKTLAPGLRLGWLVVPRHLVDSVVEAKELADRGSPALDQLALADFIARGEFDRHLRRMRPIYRRRRDALLTALAARLPDWRPAGVAAGTHLLAWLPDGLDEAGVVAAARARGVGVYGVAPYRLADGPPGIIFGYATLDEDAIAAGVELLVAALATPSAAGA